MYRRIKRQNSTSAPAQSSTSAFTNFVTPVRIFLEPLIVLVLSSTCIGRPY